MARVGELLFWNDHFGRPDFDLNAIGDNPEACRLAGADAVAYDHCDPDSLAWELRQTDGRHYASGIWISMLTLLGSAPVPLSIQ